MTELAGAGEKKDIFGAMDAVIESFDGMRTDLQGMRQEISYAKEPYYNEEGVIASFNKLLDNTAPLLPDILDVSSHTVEAKSEENRELTEREKQAHDLAKSARNHMGLDMGPVNVAQFFKYQNKRDIAIA